jgi:hypothetical protein
MGTDRTGADAALAAIRSAIAERVAPGVEG